MLPYRIVDRCPGLHSETWHFNSEHQIGRRIPMPHTSCVRVSRLIQVGKLYLYPWILHHVYLTQHKGWLMQRWNIALDTADIASRPVCRGHVPKHSYFVKGHDPCLPGLKVCRLSYCTTSQPTLRIRAPGQTLNSSHRAESNKTSSRRSWCTYLRSISVGYQQVRSGCWHDVEVRSELKPTMYTHNKGSKQVRLHAYPVADQMTMSYMA